MPIDGVVIAAVIIGSVNALVNGNYVDPREPNGKPSPFCDYLNESDRYQSEEEERARIDKKR